MRPALISTLLVALAATLGCTEPMEDATLMACIKPLHSEVQYPANTPLPVSVLIQADSGEIRNFECEVEQSGEFELTIHATWRERDKYDSIEDTEVDCGYTPELAEGRWTVIHGDHSKELVIPSHVEPSPHEDIETRPGTVHTNGAFCISP